MSKKILVIASFLLIFGFVYGRTPTQGNMWNVSDYDGVYGAELNTDGALVPLTSGTGALGNTTYKWNAVMDDVTADHLTINTDIDIPDLTLERDSWDNLVAKSSYVVAVVNIATATVKNSSGYVMVSGDFNQIGDAPRNIYFDFSSCAASSATVTYCGLDNLGEPFSSTQIIGNITDANTNDIAVSVVYGATITFNTGYAQDADVIICVGTGDKIGFLHDIDSSSSVRSAKVQTSTTWAGEVGSLTINATYNTWLHSDVPDAADDYRIMYTANSE